MNKWHCRVLSLCLPLLVSILQGQSPAPEICGYAKNGTTFIIQAHVPEGYRFVQLQGLGQGNATSWESLASGPVSGKRAVATFRLPDTPENPISIVRVRVGASDSVPEATHTGDDYVTISYTGLHGSGEGNNGDSGGLLGGGGLHGESCSWNLSRQYGHLLHRIAYGPSYDDFQRLSDMGTTAYIEEQLNPSTIDETDNERLNDQLSDFYLPFLPNSGTPIIESGSTWRYFKGTEEPPEDWNTNEFGDIFWEQGQVGIGYGDDDDATVLEDMAGNDGYLSVYLRKTFDVPDPDDTAPLAFRISYDDGYVAYLNGEEVGRANVSGNPPPFDQQADESGGNVDSDEDPGVIDLQPFQHLLVEGKNVIAVQVHNSSTNSSDFSAHPQLLEVSSAKFEAVAEVDSLLHLMHARGIYSRRQLQTVLADFWENHFTTDYNKIEDYLGDHPAYERLQTDGNQRLIAQQIEAEGSTMEMREYNFFHSNALGHFGDLLLYSATSPTMLIYLDNVINDREEPNENYAREILELYAFGVDNRYNQTDIEELARCFTGWTIRKASPDDVKPFPESANNPFTTQEQTVIEEVAILDLGPGWRYLKGTAEPTPEDDAPGTGWTEPDYNDGAWTSGSTGIGYGDNDDATELNDMEDNYTSVYLRREFVYEEPDTTEDVVIHIAYDDGYVAYLNGEEISRSVNMQDFDETPGFDDVADYNHEVDDDPDVISFEAFRHLLRQAPETNVLAIQVHNATLSSSDLSMQPRILGRTYSSDSIPVTSPDGVWTFRFNPDNHDFDGKTLFAGTPEEITIPNNRSGVDGVLDALNVIEAMEHHPSTSEFISIKLIQKFVSDDIVIDSFHDRSAPAELLELADDLIAAWHSTPRPGHIQTLMRALLDPENQSNAFWTDIAYRSKIKTPIETVISAYRALDAVIDDAEVLGEWGETLGMEVFERADPDGYSEFGYDWMNTVGLLGKMQFVQLLAAGDENSGTEWDAAPLVTKENWLAPDDALDYFARFLFDDYIPEERRAVYRDYVNTADNGFPSDFASQPERQKLIRLQRMIGLLLSSPEFQLQ